MSPRALNRFQGEGNMARDTQCGSKLSIPNPEPVNVKCAISTSTVPSVAERCFLTKL